MSATCSLDPPDIPCIKKDLNTDKIREWRSIITLIIFVVSCFTVTTDKQDLGLHVTNVIVLFPFHIPIPVPRGIWNAWLDGLSFLRIIPPRTESSQLRDDGSGKAKRFVRLNLPLNFVTAPLIADLFLLAILAIGRKEVHDGTIGANHIHPLDIMVFFLTLAYIAISIDASGLIRWLAFMVLKKGGERGHWLFFYLYCFFFGLASFIGNDPIVLSGTAFLAYMTRVSNNIKHPRAWIHTQFAVANIGSAILVSSNPTNLVLAGAFSITFIKYTANIIVPVVVTAVLLFPFLLWIVFPYESLIPSSIKLHELPAGALDKKPVNPNIPHARGTAEEEEDEDNEEGKRLSLEEIMNPFLDRWGAGFGAVIMAVTLITILLLNAIDQKEHPVFWVTLPAACVMFCWDVAFGWFNREETRRIAQEGRKAVEDARRAKEEQNRRLNEDLELQEAAKMHRPTLTITNSSDPERMGQHNMDDGKDSAMDPSKVNEHHTGSSAFKPHDTNEPVTLVSSPKDVSSLNSGDSPEVIPGTPSSRAVDEKDSSSPKLIKEKVHREQDRLCLTSLVAKGYVWCSETFPTVTAVLSHLPYALVPFAFCMFVLVQALVTKGWVPVFAYGWDHWVRKTGTVGAIGGMGFLSVIMCNFCGTNIGTTILLCRVIQAWVEIHIVNNTTITERTFWATVYSMALGVNYGAFSTAFSASLAGLLWRDILRRKHIFVKELEFARVNIRIIAFAMAIGCTVLIGEVYVVRHETPYQPKTG